MYNFRPSTLAARNRRLSDSKPHPSVAETKAEELQHGLRTVRDKLQLVQPNQGVVERLQLVHDIMQCVADHPAVLREHMAVTVARKIDELRRQIHDKQMYQNAETRDIVAKLERVMAELWDRMFPTPFAPQPCRLALLPYGVMSREPLVLHVQVREGTFNINAPLTYKGQPLGRVVSIVCNRNQCITAFTNQNYIIRTTESLPWTLKPWEELVVNQ